jgi:hypothetical protein
VEKDKNLKSKRVNRHQSHMPESNIYEKGIPAILITLGIFTAVLIIVGLGIAFGLIPY